MTDRQGEQLSSQELDFLQRWRLLIDGLGGQKQAAEKMDWSTSTVSRDYSGQTLPSSQRLNELSHRHDLPGGERTELRLLLQQARDARDARRKNAGKEPPAPPARPRRGHRGSGGRPPGWHAAWVAPGRMAVSAIGRGPGRRWVVPAAVASVVVVAAGVLAGVLASSSGGGSSGAEPVGSTETGIKGSFPGTGVKTVSIPVASLSADFRLKIRKDNSRLKAVTGFEFRSALHPADCLTADDTGSLAGQDRDPVKVAACALAANQVWIPWQWETRGLPYTHLVSAKYQGECLNARKTDGDAPGPGSAVILFHCYVPSGNESWAFDLWHQSVEPGHRSYPLFLSNNVKNKRFCIDADNLPDVTPGVRLWSQQAMAGQFWY